MVCLHDKEFNPADLLGTNRKVARNGGSEHHRWPNRYFEQLGLLSVHANPWNESRPWKG